jgi:hypothetical protein
MLWVPVSPVSAQLEIAKAVMIRANRASVVFMMVGFIVRSKWPIATFLLSTVIGKSEKAVHFF